MHEPRPDPTAVRDAGFELVRQINGWLLAGAAAATGALSLLAASSFHGHTASASTAPASVTGQTGVASGSTGATGATGATGSTGSGEAPSGAVAPAPAPSVAAAPPVAVSGAS